jgi:hypothetical protein
LKTFQYASDRDAIRQILKKEGLRGIYRGYGATVASFGPFSGLYFTFYEFFRPFAVYVNLVKHGNGKIADDKIQELTFLQSMACSWAAGGLASFITNPLDLAKLRL